MKFIAALAGLFLMFLCSCQKEIELTNITTRIDSTSVIDDSTTIVKLVDLYYGMPAGQDSLFLWNFTYDSQKRLAQTDLITYDATGQRKQDNRTVLYYNGSDTLPYKRFGSDIYLPAGNIPFTYTHYYSYTAEKISTDSIAAVDNSGLAAVTKYTYFSDRIQVTDVTYYNSGTVVTNNNVYFTRTNGNTTRQTDTLVVGNPNDITISYNGKKNPFYNKPHVETQPTPYLSVGIRNEDMVYEKNNPIEAISKVRGAEAYHTKFSYQYRSNGYPSFAKVYDISNGVTDSIRRYFIYTKL